MIKSSKKKVAKKSPVIQTVHLSTASINALAVAMHKVPHVEKPAAAEKVVEGISLDQSTGLMWCMPTDKRMTWKEASEYCSKLEFGGYKDWHLPTIKELLTPVDYSKHNPAADKAKFPFIKADWYWSSTPAASDPSSHAWLVNFSYGYSLWSNQYGEGLVLACRSASQ